MKTGHVPTEYAHTHDDYVRMRRWMHTASDSFYSIAVRSGVHAFIEFAGLMNEFIKLCLEAEEKGIDFTMASTHTGVALPMQDYNAKYLAEKLNCIYGMAFLQDKKVRDAFIKTLFEGQYKLVEVEDAQAVHHP